MLKLLKLKSGQSTRASAELMSVDVAAFLAEGDRIAASEKGEPSGGASSVDREGDDDPEPGDVALLRTRVRDLERQLLIEQQSARNAGLQPQAGVRVWTEDDEERASIYVFGGASEKVLRLVAESGSKAIPPRSTSLNAGWGVAEGGAVSRSILRIQVKHSALPDGITGIPLESISTVDLKRDVAMRDGSPHLVGKRWDAQTGLWELVIKLEPMAEANDDGWLDSSPPDLASR